MTTYYTPSGSRYTLFDDMLDQPHLLIAGATGSGKSVVISGLLYNLMYRPPVSYAGGAQFILIDPKKVSLSMYKYLPHTLFYADTHESVIQAMLYGERIMDDRFADMQRRGIRDFDGSDVYIIIDELMDLMTTKSTYRQFGPVLQRIAQLGRAAKVHVIAATQCPLREVIPTAIKVNFDARVGLRTRSAQDSRNIISKSGLETLPRYGIGYYMRPGQEQYWKIPYVQDDQTNSLIAFWMNQVRPQPKLFARMFRR